ncbi:MAG TPA: S8 family serine peptidase, partial [Nitrolancea sp.]|nr:S8 family serine peptidase [Nitrolancea sp.]
MSKRIQIVLPLLVVLALLGAAPAAASDIAPSDVASYVVALSPMAINSGVSASDVAAQYDVDVAHDFPALHEFSLELTSEQAAQLETDPNVAAIIPDSTISLTDDPAVDASGSAAAAEPAIVDQRSGVDRIHADTPSLPDGILASNVNVAVLDTGVSTKQPALNVVGGYNCTDADAGSYGDTNGHGSHVAGIIAASDLGTGPRGVVPGAQIWSVKVFNTDGQATFSEFLCGMNWIVEHADTIQVVNFSAIFDGVNYGGCGMNSNGQVIDPIHQAVCQLVDGFGIPFVDAAGNGGSMASDFTPAVYPETISVGAIVD